MRARFLLCAALPCASVVAALPASAFAQATPILDKADTAWMMVCSLLVLMMSLPGLAFFYGGLVKKDNILATAMQTLAVALLVSLLWPALCYSLAFGSGTRWLGNLDNAMLHAMSASSLSGTIPESVFVFFQMTFAIITAGILVGAVADRIKFSTLMVFSTLWIIAVYTPVAHWVWGPAGLIGGLGDAEYTGLFGMGKALDFAGGTVVHITSGVGGLVAALVMGKGRYHAHHAQSNNLLLSVLGASLLWVGWFGFNAGSALVSGTQAGMAMLVNTCIGCRRRHGVAAAGMALAAQTEHHWRNFWRGGGVGGHYPCGRLCRLWPCIADWRADERCMLPRRHHHQASVSI